LTNGLVSALEPDFAGETGAIEEVTHVVLYCIVLYVQMCYTPGHFTPHYNMIK